MKYAKMFLNTAGSDSMHLAISELESVNRLMTENRELINLLENPLFSRQERERVITDISARLKLSDNTVRFILHLSEQRIISYFSELMRFATVIYLERKSMIKAVVTTPAAIEKKYEERLKISLKNLTGRDVDLTYIIDPSILGGIIVHVGSTMYDSSIKGQLRLLKDGIMKG